LQRSPEFMPDSPGQPGADFVFGPFRLLTARHELLAHGVPVAIGQRALDVLLVLVRRHGELVTKDELMGEVWPGVTVEENNLAVHISALRKILGQAEDGKSYLQTVAGRGYRFVGAVTRHDLTRSAQPAESTAATKAAPPRADIPHNLPQLLSGLIGRAEELGILRARLQQHRLVTLTGSGGVGKTRLAVEAGVQALRDYPDGVWLIDLAPIKGAVVPSVVSEVLGVGNAGHTAGGLAAAIKSRHVLLILDNCEHVLVESAQLAETIVRACPLVSILATSRERLAVAGESVFRLPSLAGPQAIEGLTAQAARSFPAIAMFVERAAALGEGFVLTDENVAAVAAICRRIDGIPLAIELAAPRLRVLSERQLASGLDRRFALLTGGSRTAVPRHQTLHALIEWSYELLSRAEQQMLRRLSVFSGGSTLASIAAVVTGDDITEAQVFDLIAALVEKSLVIAERQRDEARYRLAESTRYFASDKLLAAREQERHRQHARHLARRLEEAADAWESTASEPWLARYGADIDNLRTALAWSFGPDGSAAIGLELVGYSHVLWSELALMLEHRYWVERGLALASADTPQAIVARLLSWQAGDLKDVDDPTDVDDALRAAALHHGLGDPFEQGKMLLRAGAGRLIQDSGGDGERLLRQALDLLRPFGNTKTLARCLSALASARLFAEDKAGAQSLHQEAVAITRGLAAMTSTAPGI
jgi:predicted ATPase/DNA-binding winged helix-turn-helix (wHTH) protein